jgi:hypothetical protein
MRSSVSITLSKSDIRHGFSCSPYDDIATGRSAIDITLACALLTVIYSQYVRVIYDTNSLAHHIDDLEPAVGEGYGVWGRGYRQHEREGRGHGSGDHQVQRIVAQILRLKKGRGNKKGSTKERKKTEKYVRKKAGRNR